MLGAEGGPLLASGARATGKRLAELARLRPRRRSDAIVGDTVGRPAAAGRDPQGALPRRRDPDPRRADRRADAAGDRPALRDAPAAAGAGQDRHPHHPQAARDHGLTDRVSVMRQGEVVATFDTAETSPPELAELMVGRDGAAARREGRGAARRGRARGAEPRRCATTRRRAGRRRLASTCAPARSSASPASPATARPNCSRRWPASGRRAAARSSVDGRTAAGGSSTTRVPSAARPRPRARGPPARGPGHAVRGVRRTRCSATTTSRSTAAGFLCDRRRSSPTRTRKMEAFDVRPRGAAAQDRQFLRRQPAEAGPGARDRRATRRCCWSASRRAASTSARSSSSTRHRRAARRRQGASCWSRSSSTRSSPSPTASS